jgi:hypothetical protein
MLSKLSAVWRFARLILFGLCFAIFVSLSEHTDPAKHPRHFFVAWILGAMSPYIFIFPYAKIIGAHPVSRALRTVQSSIRFLIFAGMGLLWGMLAAAPLLLAFPHPGRLPLLCVFGLSQAFWLGYLIFHWNKVTNWFEGWYTRHQRQKEDPLTPVYRDRVP